MLSKLAEMWPGKISTRELKKKIDRGDHFILVDARDTNSYKSEHIMGAISLPLSEVDEKADQLLDKSIEVIVYCNSFACPTSANEVKKLRQMGFGNVKHYAGGIQDWKTAGYTTKSSSRQEGMSYYEAMALSSDVKPDRVLDCVGLYCPEPVFRTRLEIDRMTVGEILEVLADDPAAEEDIKSLVKRIGHKLLKLEADGTVTRLLIEKTR